MEFPNMVIKCNILAMKDIDTLLIKMKKDDMQEIELTVKTPDFIDEKNNDRQMINFVEEKLLKHSGLNPHDYKIINFFYETGLF